MIHVCMYVYYLWALRRAPEAAPEGVVQPLKRRLRAWLRAPRHDREGWGGSGPGPARFRPGRNVSRPIPGCPGPCTYGETDVKRVDIEIVRCGLSAGTPGPEPGETDMRRRIDCERELGGRELRGRGAAGEARRRGGRCARWKCLCACVARYAPHGVYFRRELPDDDPIPC
jgi:hypothetical protein